MQAQGRRLDEQSERIAALERSRRRRNTNSPPRRHQATPSPPRPAAVKHRRPDLERVEVTPRKRDRTPPHREGRLSPGKKGKHEAPRRHSPQGLALMSKQGASGSYRPRKSRSPTPMPGDYSPRSSEDHSPNGSDEGDPRCPLSRDILRKHIPKGFERPPTLPAYDGLTDPDDHIANVNANLDFRNISGAIRCRLFPTTLRKGAMAWYQSLPPQSIHSWRDLTEQFCRHFTASRKHPKTVHALEAIYQAEEETLRNFVERFNKEAVQVETTDDMKKYLLQRGLRPGSDFAKAVGIEKPPTWDDLLLKAQKYIEYEEVQAADVARLAGPGSSHPARESSHRSDDRGGDRGNDRGGDRGGERGRDRRRGERREPRGPPSTFSTYTPLVKSRGEIFAEHVGLFHRLIRISGGRMDKHTVGSIKRKFEELINTSSNMNATLDKAKGRSMPLAFYREELPGGSANFQIPLLVRADMANMDVRRVLIDPGSSCDIMYASLFRTLQLDETHLTPYLGSDLTGFNGATTKPWGYVDLIVTFGSEETAKSIRVKFLVVDCPCLYQCIIGRTTIADLIAVPSTAHLKMKYYTHKGQVATLHGDIEAARRCFDAATKGNNFIGKAPEPKKPKPSSKTPPKPSPEAPPSLPGPSVSSVDLDSRTSKKEDKEEKKLRKEEKEDDEASKEHYRPIPDGDFEIVQFGGDPAKGVKIGTGLPDLARKQLKACLRENADLFAWHAADIPGLDPNIACHQLTVDPLASVVVQRRRRQSPEKAEAAEKAVKDLLEANFISEARYTTWLSNVVLVKKSNGKWRMCVDYTDLNRACPKDSYPLPCIDKLVDNSSGFKLLSFMDAYSGYNQIPMAVADREKTAFMTESGNYYYNVMPFGLKNAGATYQRMMNRVFRGEIGDMLEVYMDDMIVKSHEEIDHTAHLRKVFEQARRHNMRFNPEKCTFGIRAGKFLGFYLTERGIEANPDKCRAFTELPTPSNKKFIQTLNGMLTSLSRFVAKSAQHALPLFKLLRKEAVFEWTDECEQALQHLKKALSEPPVLSRPNVEEVLYIYLSVASEAVSATLVRETTEGQKPVYFTSKALQGPELRYTQIEKVALALINAARRLRHYFLAHTIVVRTDQPIKSLLGRPDMAGRMLKWSLELSEFDIRYESRKALKSQVLADFVAEMTSPSSTTSEADKWTIFVDGASSATGAGTGIILENENGIIIEVSLALSFPTSNNQAEYEAFLAGLRLAEDMEAKEIKIYTDSQLVASQVLGEYQAKNDNLSEYLALVKEKITKFESVEVQHVPREHNKRADILSKLASTKKKGGNKSVIQEILPRPSIEKTTNVLDINVIGDKNCWMTPVYNFLANGTLPDDQKEAAIIRLDYILREVHEGINAQHLGGRSLARKALRAGYYWPTMQQDAKDHVKKCDKCQRHGDMHLAPPHELKSMSSPWPFAWWGMDILGPFTKGLHQNKFIIVSVDYFTKWVEAEPISDITSFRILRFFKRDVLCRFGIPQAIVTDNGTQFTDKGFQDFLAALGTKQHFTSVEHPQTNGQAEAANRVILPGLRRRLDQNKKKWVEELESVLWAYRTTPHSTTGETPFRMVYGTESVIPVEVGEPSRRAEQPLEEEMNDEALREELDLVDEIRTGASLREATLKQKIAARHDVKVIKREFEVGSLVLRRNAKDTQDGKLAANWEGPYRVIDKTENGAYYLEDLLGKKLPRPWNAQKLKQYYS
ncbi:unnamed protein product [Trifolium pratense]|uniref:Uncharacterized protein n=1 Tax=Trifolium pratense TaxID=57577 RepID=A0ACB0KDV3_TRIPR|nr:unnamed protein product [Trifolium pratense]